MTKLYALWGIEPGEEWELFTMTVSNESGHFEDPIGLLSGLYYIEEVDRDRWEYLEEWDTLTERAKNLLRPDGLFRLAEAYTEET